MRLLQPWSGLLFGVLLAAQDKLPPHSFESAPVGVGGSWILQLPAADAANQWRPLLVLVLPPQQDSQAAAAAAAGLLRAAAGQGCVVAATASGVISASWVASLRQRFTIEQGGMHLIGIGSGTPAATALALAAPHEFQSVTWFGSEGLPSAVELGRLPHRALRAFAAGPELPGLEWSPAPAAMPEALGAQIHSLLARRQSLPMVAPVARALDAFHDAAAKGNADAYFALLPDDSVFLGTDASERWTGAEFRRFAAPYFRGRPAWIYVTLQRQIEFITPETASFDELLDNEAYGICRGSGVMVRRNGGWVVHQYNLSIPVPNALARPIVARIRAAAVGQAAQVTTVVLVRHAEKQDGDDPELTGPGLLRAERLAAMLAELPVKAVFASQFRRTQATVAPICAARGLTPQIVPAGAAKALVQRLQGLDGAVAVVAAHSNTIPGLLAALGVDAEVTIEDEDYGNLLIIQRSPDGTQLLRLRF